jgi:ABC-type Mn2+/Zn2+ transport system ATPase subunit
MVSVEQNFGLANQKHFACFGVLRGGARCAEARKYASDLQIRPPNILTPMANLSGGNRQKFVIARWLATGARVLMFDEPSAASASERGRRSTPCSVSSPRQARPFWSSRRNYRNFCCRLTE